MGKQGLESEFQKYFIEKAHIALPRAIFLAKEVPIHKAYDLLKREYYERDEDGKRIIKANRIGAIDLLFRYRGREYVAEIKYYPFSNSEFWDALKVLGYSIYYNWEHQTDTKPAIMMPKNKIKLEHRIVAGKLNVAIFGITKYENGYSVELHQE